MKFTSRLIVLSLGVLVTLSQAAYAADLDVKLTPELDSFQFKAQGKTYTIKRIQEPTHTIDESWAKTSRKCPPFCPHPMNVSDKVTTVGEVEVFDFMRNKVDNGTGILIDARVPAWHKKGTIPGSINIPFTEFELKPSDPKLAKYMKMIKAKPRGQVGFVDHAWDKTLETVGVDTERTGFWDYSESPELLFWCNGPWCGQSPHAIRGLLALGFPPEKIHYYRGGMQMWELMGLPVVVPEGN